MVDTVFFWLASLFVRLVQLLPLQCVALAGRAGGFLFYYLDFRHRRVAVNNLCDSLGNSRSQKEIVSIAKENFCRIGEVYLSAIKTAAIPNDKLASFLKAKGGENINLSRREDGSLPSLMFAIGHFGNFELYAKTGVLVPDFELSTTYRGFNMPWLEKLIFSLRKRSGISFFERRRDGAALRMFMNRPGTITGLLCDQSAGRKGLMLPFFGRLCSVTPSPALFSLRYNLALHVCFCRRLGLGRWELEVCPEIQTVSNGHPRPIEDIMMDVNKLFESFILEDPANWFWFHNRWKTYSPT